MDPEITEIAAWLQQTASSMSLEARPHPERARREHDWIYLPVRIEGTMGAFERAEHLQDLEDKWDREHASSATHLVLVPTSG